MKIVTLTLSPALDKSTSLDRLLPEKKLRCEPLRIDAGGGGINVSKGIARLGGKSAAVFPAGGANGQQLCRLVEKAGIQAEVIESKSETRESFSVVESDTNAQYRFTLPGVEMSRAEARACLDRVKKLGPEYLVASGSLPPGLPETFYEEVAAFAKKIGARFILDTSGPALRAAADEGLYLLKPNLHELSALSGAEKLEMNQVDDAAMQIIAQGQCEVVLVSLGPQGALLATKKGFEHIPAPQVHKRTTVGAGDSTVAGMIWGLSEGKPPREAAQLAVACGSAATMGRGTELFHREDVDKLLRWIETYGERYRFQDF